MHHRTALTHAITNAPSYTALHQLIIDNAAEFNVYHTCASLSRVLALHARGFSPREARLFKEGCSALQGVLRRQLQQSELHPRAVVVAAHSLAKLELPDRELLAGLAGAVEPQLHVLQVRGLRKARRQWCGVGRGGEGFEGNRWSRSCTCCRCVGWIGVGNKSSVVWVGVGNKASVVWGGVRGWGGGV